MSNTFNLKVFQKVFDSYLLKLWGICTIPILFFSGIYTVAAIGLLSIETELPSFLYRIIAPFEFDQGIAGIPIGGRTFAFVTFGAVSVGVVSIGAASVGVVSIGGHSLGIIAIGGGTSFKFFAKTRGTRGRFDIGKAVGVIAVSPESYGVYTLSYSGAGTYSFSPSRQDATAVAFFCRWFPKFKKTFHS